VSGIIGALNLDNKPVEPVELAKMLDSISHRGPDGCGVWIDGPIGLGQCMLWTTPESLIEKYPLKNPRGDLILTADARIDNREELLLALELEENTAQKVTDGQLILSAYEKWGQACPEKLIGDFAFGVWDNRNQILFCARDPIGAKSLFYFKSQSTFVFGSEIKAILLASAVPHQLNELKLAEHLVQFFEDRTLTFYKDIFRLSPANSITVGPGEFRMRVYWSLDPKREIKMRSDEEYSQSFLEILTEAIRCRLRSAFPVGSTLSGGLDSSSIACIARKLVQNDGKSPLHTFSAIFPTLPEKELRKIDEREFIKTVVALGGFNSHYIEADHLSPLTDVDQALWLQDEPFLAPNLYMHWGLYRAAKDAGVRVFLDGIDGDVTISYGLESLADLTRSGRWKKLYEEATAISKKPNASISPRRIIWEYGFLPIIPQSVFRIWRIVHGDKNPSWFENTSIKPGFADRVHLEERVKSLSKNGLTIFSGARWKHWQSLNSSLIPLGLELLDKVTNNFSIEARYPFFDRRLVEFCLALPSDQKLSNGWTRIVMRRAMEGILPPEIQWRFTKADLSPNFLHNLYEYENSTIDNIFSDQNNANTIAPYVELTELVETYRQYKSQPFNDENVALILYGVVILAIWLQRYDLVS
jgi:asparagine synthase (glutamine-hydrolysing)